MRVLHGRPRLRGWLRILVPFVAAAGASIGGSVSAHPGEGAVWLEETETEPAVLAFRPTTAATRRPVVVMLHGMCDPPQRECPYFAGTVTEFAWLVCPRARLRCPGGETLWDWRNKYQTVDTAVERVRRFAPDEVDTAGERILIGFSLGALAAMDIAHRGDGRWQRLMLIGAEVYPNARLLERAGVKRVLLASGQRDMMRWHMETQAKRLDAQGIASRYMSMGPVGHWFAPDMDTWMSEALAWLLQDEASTDEADSSGEATP